MMITDQGVIDIWQDSQCLLSTMGRLDKSGIGYRENIDTFYTLKIVASS